MTSPAWLSSAGQFHISACSQQALHYYIKYTDKQLGNVKVIRKSDHSHFHLSVQSLYRLSETVSYFICSTYETYYSTTSYSYLTVWFECICGGSICTTVTPLVS